MEEFRITKEDLYDNGNIRPFEDVYTDPFNAAFQRLHPYTWQLSTDLFYVRDIDGRIIAYLDRPFNRTRYNELLHQGIEFEAFITLI